jgi:Fe-Mn family superoxide dismutase
MPYVLPDLEYDYGALEPHLSGRIMELHHDKHHAAYVKNANSLLEQLEEARDHRDFAHIACLEEAFSFNLSGHVLHSIFWKNLSPEGGDSPTGELARAIDQDFGGFNSLKEQLTHVASTIMGSGWAALVWEPLGRRLLTSQIHDHQSNVSQGGIALLVIDAWEHAYYLQYQTEKGSYFDALWKLWNWHDVEERFQAATSANLLVPASAR